MKNRPSTSERFYVVHNTNKASTAISLRVGQQFEALRPTTEPSLEKAQRLLGQNATRDEKVGSVPGNSANGNTFSFFYQIPKRLNSAGNSSQEGQHIRLASLSFLVTSN